MNPQYVAIIISAAGVIVSIVLAVFTANWLSARHTDRLIDQSERNTARLIDQLERRLSERDGRLTAELQGVRTEIKAQGEVVAARLDALDSRLRSVESRLERLEAAIFKPVLPGRGD
jgi:chromosome segregation ATPase